ncbi:MAG: nitrilase-related carbon-nitrogen hydrolase, partial [Solimonas sp.]
MSASTKTAGAARTASGAAPAAGGAALIAAVQMNSGDDVAANLDAAELLLREAAAGGARLAVLPENFAFMGKHDR